MAYYQRRKNRMTGTTITVCPSEGADAADGLPWTTICEDHGYLVCHPNLALARAHAADPDWCEKCQELMSGKASHVADPLTNA